MKIQKFRNRLVIILRGAERSSKFKQVEYECPIDFDQFGNVMGVEVEAPCYSFGASAVENLELIQ